MKGMRARGAWLWGALLCLCAGMVQAQNLSGGLPFIRDGAPRAVASSGQGSCGLNPDGSLHCWGLVPGNLPAGPLAALYSGYSGTYCGLRADGSASCTAGDNLLPPGERFRSLAVGSNFTCGLRVNGTAFCWGGNTYGQLNVPGGTFTSLASGVYHACGLRPDGSTECWGAGAPGTPSGTAPHFNQGVPPAGKTFVSLTAGIYNTCGLQADGAAVCWGRDTGAYARLLNPPEGGFYSLAAAGNEVCGLHANGDVTCWGVYGDWYEHDGQSIVALTSVRTSAFCGLRGDGSVDCWDSPYTGSMFSQDWGQIDPPEDDFIQIAAGYDFGCGLHEDGTVACWTGEDNNYGQLDIPEGANHDFISIGAGDSFTCGLRADHTYQCWGYDVGGTSGGYLTEAPVGETFSHLAVGGYHVCGVKYNDGSVVCWGSNAVTTNTGTNIPMPNESFDPASLVGESTHACGLRTSDHTAVCWGSAGLGIENEPADAFSSLGLGFGFSCGVREADATAVCWGLGWNYSAPSPSPPEAVQFQSVAPGLNYVCGLSTDNSLYCWGNNGLGQLNAPAGNDFVQVSSGDNYSCALRSNGETLCWGAQLDPADLVGPFGLGKVAAGAGHTCDLAANGTLACSGFNGDGQATAPTGTFRDIGAGDGFSCAISNSTETGPVASCWGSNEDGRATPYFDDDMGSYVSVELGAYNGCAWQGYGEPLCWGLDNHGQSTPPLAPEGRHYRQVSAGAFHSCGVYDDNSGECWGYDYTTEGATQSVPAGVSWLVLSAGNGFTCGLKTDGGLQCWGDIANPPAGKYRALSAGFFHACAIRDTGKVQCWGDNTYGQAASRPEAEKYVSVSAGEFHTCAIREDGQRVCWGEVSDTTKPTVTALLDGTLGNSGWYVGDAGLTWEVGDTKSAIRSTSGCGATSVVADTAGTTYTCIATSSGGTTSKSQTIKRDATPPTIVAAATKAPNVAGWYKATVTVKYTCVDVLSGMASCPAQVQMDGEGADQTAPTPQAMDKAGNTSAPSNTVTMSIDKTAPGIVAQASGTEGANGWYTSDVTIHYDCTDALSGVASCPADSVFKKRGANLQGPTGKATDVAGNTANSESLTLNIDINKPTISEIQFSGPLVVGAEVTASAVAEDPQSGIASSECEPVDTSKAKKRNLTCTVTNGAGLVATKKVSYTVTAE